MKKILSIVMLAMVALGGVAVAAPGSGGFVTPPAVNPKGGFQQSREVNISSVKEAKALPDDAIVVLRGYIIEQLGDDKYRFKDETLDETIVIEIDDDEWKGQVVTPEDLIIVYGEMDKGLLSTEVDVKRLHKVSSPRMGKGAPRAAATHGCTNCGCGAAQKN